MLGAGVSPAALVEAVVTLEAPMAAVALEAEAFTEEAMEEATGKPKE